MFIEVQYAYREVQRYWALAEISRYERTCVNDAQIVKQNGTSLTILKAPLPH